MCVVFVIVCLLGVALDCSAFQRGGRATAFGGHLSAPYSFEDRHVLNAAPTPLQLPVKKAGRISKSSSRASAETQETEQEGEGEGEGEGEKGDEDSLSSAASQRELQRLQELEDANKEEFAALIKAKLDGWMQMKAEGILDKLGMDGATEETVLEMDEMSKRLLRRKRGLKKTLGGGSLSEAVDEATMKEDAAKAVSDLLEKLAVVGHSKTGTALGVQSLLNEIKDKQVETTELAEACLMALTRLGSSSITLNAYKQYQRWIVKGSVQKDLDFSERFTTACFASGTLVEAGESILELVTKEEGPGFDTLPFLPGLVCRDIFSSASTSDSSELKSSLRNFYTLMPGLSSSKVNIVLRALGKRRLVADIFTLIEQMRIRGPAPDDETIEFLASALVASVEEEAKAKTMKDLPKPQENLPEVVFAGRSNVGKSSLVNFMVNRKALASTSATPGHTTQFHFFHVNEGRTDLPSFRLVDVPGLGYAEAAENTQDSWRSLLERYMAVRDSLGMVFHLVDSRHKITAVDQQMMEMACRAATLRKQEGRAPLRYAVILTKTDRASEKALKESKADVRNGVKELAEVTGAQIPIITTSSLAREGRDELWKLLIDVVGGAAAR